jgi:hypothetical protein
LKGGQPGVKEQASVSTKGTLTRELVMWPRSQWGYGRAFKVSCILRDIRVNGSSANHIGRWQPVLLHHSLLFVRSGRQTECGIKDQQLGGTQSSMNSSFQAEIQRLRILMWKSLPIARKTTRWCALNTFFYLFRGATSKLLKHRTRKWSHLSWCSFPSILDLDSSLDPVIPSHQPPSPIGLDELVRYLPIPSS